MKSWAWVGGAMGVRGSRLGRRARRQRPRLEHLEDRLAPALSIGLSTLTGTVGTAYCQQITTTGGGVNDTYSYSLATAQGDPPNNGLPPGLSLNATTGLLSGTPTAPGAYDIVVAVTDNTTGATGEEAFPLSISPLITLSGSLANATEYAAVSGERDHRDRSGRRQLHVRRDRERAAGSLAREDQRDDRPVAGHAEPVRARSRSRSRPPTPTGTRVSSRTR